MSVINLKEELKEIMTSFYNEIYKGLDKLLEKHIGDISKDDKPIFRRKNKGEKYYSILLTFMGNEISISEEENTEDDRKIFDKNNYFHTRQRAQSVLDKITLLLKLERLHDIYCPDYYPDWDDPNDTKCCVVYDHKEHNYNIYIYDGRFKYMEELCQVWFSSDVINTVLEIMNEELKSNDTP